MGVSGICALRAGTSIRSGDSKAICHHFSGCHHASGLGKLRIYDEALGLMGMLVILVAMIKRSENTRAHGAALMLAGSVLFVLKVSVPPWLIPGDWLHLGMAFGLILVTPEMLVMRDLPSAQEII